MPKVHFCTFGSLDTYAAALARIQKQATASGYFDTVTCYTQKNTPGLDDHAEFITANPKGYGFWMWKPLVILDVMRTAAPDDIIVYADAGCFINSTETAKRKFAVFLSLVRTRAPHRLSFQMPHIEEHYTKGDVLDLLQMRDTEHAKSGQLVGGYQVMLNTNENRAIIEEWYRVMTLEGHKYHDDSPSTAPNAPTFVASRHDQSIISLLMKKNGTIMLRDAWPLSDKDPISPMRSRGA